MISFFKDREKRLKENFQSTRIPPRPRKFSQTTWLAMMVVVVAAIVYITPRYEEADHQTLQIPANSFHGYAIMLSKPNLIGVEITSLHEQPFDFYILPTEEFELLKSYIVNGKDPNHEIAYNYRLQNTQKVKLSNFSLPIGYYTLVMDNTYYDTGAAEGNLLLDFKILRKKEGF